MPAEITCPRCQKTFAAPPESEGVWRYCPHCHVLNPEGLNIEGKSAARPAPGETRCAKCGRLVAISEIEPKSSTCSECATAIRAGSPLRDRIAAAPVLIAQQRSANLSNELETPPGSPGAALLGGCLIMMGVLIGAGCGLTMMGGGEGIGDGRPVLGVIWILGGLAFMFAGIRMIKAATATTGGDVWDRCGVAMMSAVLGIGAWLFVFVTCASGGF